MIAGIAHLGLIDEEDIVLDAAALELAALDHGDADLAPYGDLLAAIGERVATIGADAATGPEQAAVLAQVIAGEYGFSGDRARYDDPANADMIRVIDRRRGLPVSLSILYVAAARRVGWEADALNTPGHVLVGIGHADAPLLIDPFGGGRAVEPEWLAALLAAGTGGDAFPAASHLQPMPNRAVLVRLLLNQATRAEQAGDGARAQALYERMTVIAPANGQGWWDLARLRLAAGEIGPARDSLSSMLEMTRDPERRDHIATALEALGGEV
jgi:regulator of sirC expression with transglutaminase-like and TPR domain